MAGGRTVTRAIASVVVVVVCSVVLHASGPGGSGDGMSDATGARSGFGAAQAWWPTTTAPDSWWPTSNTSTPGTSTSTTTTPTPTTPNTGAPATSTTTTTPSGNTSTTAPTVNDGVVSMGFTGDFLWHSPLWAGAQRNWAAANPGGPSGYDFTPMLAGLEPLIAPVDLGVCHLETPIAPEGEGYTTAPLYGVPAEVAPAIAAAGYDRCSTASNHTLDRGVAGIDRTVDVLEAAGLGVSGMARTPEEIAPTVFVVNGVAISHLSYTFSYNGLRMPAGQEWRSATIDPARIVADATTARARGAELVIVSMHWGNEKDHTITSAQREVAQAITASGQVDLIVGHHAHVLQGIEQVNDVWVIYGLGNAISNMPTGSNWPAASQDAAVATVSFTRRPDGTGYDVSTPVIHPTWCDREAGWLVRLVQPTLADPTTPSGLRARLEASLERTRTVLGPFIPLG